MSTQPDHTTTLPPDHPLNQSLARRYAATTLRLVAGWPASRIINKLQCSASSLNEWCTKVTAGVGLADRRAISKRKGKSTVERGDLTTLTRLLSSGGEGQLNILSLRRAYPRHTRGQPHPKARETYRKALHSRGWRVQSIARAPAGSDAAARQQFCATHSRGGHNIADRTSFSDSKIFPGEPTATSTLPKAWAPTGKPMCVDVRQKPRYQAHVYGAINKHGASPLEFVRGTRGPSGRGRGRPRGSMGGRGGRGGGRGNGAIVAESTSVTAIYYQTEVLPPLLKWSHDTWQREGVSAHWWQQDGAGAHTTHANTLHGAAGRAVIVAGRGRLVELWPAHSPDLSPIEKAWADTERELWSAYRWTDLASFKVALTAAWAAVITPAYCRKLFGGLRQTYLVCSASGGAHVTGWGRSARVKRVANAGINQTDSDSDSEEGSENSGSEGGSD